jgi:hypothetical protein
VCTALTSFGNFHHIKTPVAPAGTVFTASGGSVLSYSNGTLRCSPKAPTVTRIHGLPALVECCSPGGLRFSGAAAIYLGPGGRHRYLTTVLGVLDHHGGMAVMAVGSADGIDWHYLSTIANASTPVVGHSAETCGLCKLPS